MTDPAAGPWSEALANLHADEGEVRGQLTSRIQDREMTHYFISEVELAMLETGSGNADRTIAGLALGAAIAFGVVNRTVARLSPYNHALFVVGFWVFLILAFYSAYRAFKARSLNRSIAAEVRKRKTAGSPADAPSPADPKTNRQKLGRWIGGDND